MVRVRFFPCVSQAVLMRVPCASCVVGVPARAMQAFNMRHPGVRLRLGRVFSSPYDAKEENTHCCLGLLFLIPLAPSLAPCFLSGWLFWCSLFLRTGLHAVAEELVQIAALAGGRAGRTQRAGAAKASLPGPRVLSAGEKGTTPSCS